MAPVPEFWGNVTSTLGRGKKKYKRIIVQSSESEDDDVTGSKKKKMNDDLPGLSNLNFKASLNKESTTVEKNSTESSQIRVYRQMINTCTEQIHIDGCNKNKPKKKGRYWCEVNYEVSPFIAEFWNTVSNLGMIIPPLFGIYEVLKLGLERKFILTHLFLIVVGFGSWAFHMTLLWPMQLADELPMVWGNSILVYQLWEIRKSARRQINWIIIVVCFTYCFFFTALYLIFQNPLIHHTMYGILVVVVLGLDLRLVNYNQCRTCTKILSVGFFMYTFGFGLWNIDNQLCSQISDIRTKLPRSLRPFTQLHAWWHILAGYATYLHILFGIHARGHFFKPKTRITMRFFGVSVAKAEPAYHSE